MCVCARARMGRQNLFVEVLCTHESVEWTREYFSDSSACNNGNMTLRFPDEDLVAGSIERESILQNAVRASDGRVMRQSLPDRRIL